MKIHLLVAERNQREGFPNKKVEVGPATCGTDGCRKNHAYAKTVPMRTGSGWCWIYLRPCLSEAGEAQLWDTDGVRK